MRAFYVVRINLQLRLAVHTGLTSSAQITVRLVSGGLLGILFHQDTSAEDTYGMIIQYILEQLVAGTIRNRMGNMAIGIHLLLLVQNGHTA